MKDKEMQVRIPTLTVDFDQYDPKNIDVWEEYIPIDNEKERLTQSIMSAKIPYLIERRESGTLPITNPEMTRFSITLDAGVRFVLETFPRIRSGEIFVPKLPSYRLQDVASAVGPDCKIQITGIRPGEKMHEEMITRSDARNTLDLDDCYIMVPDKSLVWGTIQDYRHITGGKSVPDEFSYSSENNPDFLSVMEIRELISTKFNSGSVFEDWL